jgi:hypothetical protein
VAILLRLTRVAPPNATRKNTNFGALARSEILRVECFEDKQTLHDIEHRFWKRSGGNLLLLGPTLGQPRDHASAFAQSKPECLTHDASPNTTELHSLHYVCFTYLGGSPLCLRWYALGMSSRTNAQGIADQWVCVGVAVALTTLSSEYPVILQRYKELMFLKSSSLPFEHTLALS